MYQKEKKKKEEKKKYHYTPTKKKKEKEGGYFSNIHRGLPRKDFLVGFGIHTCIQKGQFLRCKVHPLMRDKHGLPFPHLHDSVDYCLL